MKFRRIIAIALVLTQVVYFLPAQDMGEGLRRGRQRLERYLDRAAVERSAEGWEAIAAAGIEAALLEWESANLYMREGDREAWEEMRAGAAWIYGLEKEKAYVEWAGRRVYAETARLEGSALAAELRQAAADWKYLNSNETQEVGIAKQAWEKVAGEIIDRYMASWEEREMTVYSELRERIATHGIGEGEREGIYGRVGEEYRDYVLGEYQRIAAAEGNDLMRMLLYDSRSLKKQVSGGAAGTIARQLAEEARGVTDKEIARLFGELDMLISSGEQEGIRIESEEWLASFRMVFEAGLAKWDEAEYAFLTARAEWEREAERTYIESEEVWAQAYEQLEKSRQEWEKELLEKIKKGSLEWEQRQKSLWGELDTAFQEFVVTLAERKDNKQKLIKAQMEIYNKSRELMELAGEGIMFWYEEWGERYEQYEKKYLVLFESQGPPAGYEVGYITQATKWPDINTLTTDGWIKLEEQIALWKILAWAVVEKEYDDEYARLKNEINSTRETIEDLLDNNYYGITILGFQTELTAKRKKLEELEQLLREHEQAGKKLDEKLLTSEQVLTDSERGWLVLAWKYRKEADQAVVQMYRLCGVDISRMDLAEMTGYADELATELMKARAVLGYWEEEQEVAAALEEYARRYDSLLESAEQTYGELETAKGKYETALEEYNGVIEELKGKETGIEAAHEVYVEAEASLQKLSEKIKRAREEYIAIMAVMEGVSTEYICDVIGNIAIEMEKNRKGLNGLYDEYMKAVQAYGVVQQATRLEKEIRLVETGKSYLKSKADLELRLKEIQATTDIAGVFSQAEAVFGEDLWQEFELMKILKAAHVTAEGAEIARIEQAIWALWGSAEAYYHEQLSEVERAIEYLQGTWSPSEPVDEAQKRAMELWSWLFGQRAGIEAEIEDEKKNVSSRLMTLERQKDLLNRLLEITDWKIFFDTVKTERGNIDLAEVLGGVNMSLASQVMAWVEYTGQRTVWGLVEAEGNERILREFGYVGTTTLNVTEAKSWKNIAELQFENANIATLAVNIQELREAGSGLGYAEGVALREYIEKLLEYTAINDVSKGKSVDVDAITNQYEAAMGGFEMIKGWLEPEKVESAVNYMTILGSGEFAWLETEERNSLIRYGAGLILREFSVMELAAVEDFEDFRRLVQAKSLTKDWADRYSRLNREMQQALYDQMAVIYQPVTYDVAFDIYVQWYLNKAIVAGNAFGEQQLQAQAEKLNPVLAAWYKTGEFIDKYEQYLVLKEEEKNLSEDDEAPATEEVLAMMKELETVFASAEYQALFLRAESDSDYKTNKNTEWYAYYLAGPELLYVFLSSPQGFKYIPAVAEYLDETQKQKLNSYYQVESMARRYNPLLDGNISEWIAGEDIGDVEKWMLYEYLVYGEYCSGLEYYREGERAARCGNGSLIKNMLMLEQGNIFKVLYDIAYRAQGAVYRAEAMDRYASYVTRERETDDAWIQELNNCRDEVLLAMESELTDEQKEVVEDAIKAVLKEPGYTQRLGRLSDEIQCIEGYFDAAAASAGQGQSLAAADMALGQAKSKYMQAVMIEQYYEEQMSLYVKQYGYSQAEKTEQEKKKDEAYQALLAAQDEYVAYQQGAYATAVAGIQEAYAEYNRAAEELNEKHGELNAARLEVRKRQEIYDWAQSVYLSGFGENSNAEYETPLEKLGRIQYARERAEISVRVLEGMTSGNPLEDDQYNAAMAEYKKVVEQYYLGMAAKYEAALAIARQKEIVAKAQQEELAARAELIRSPEKSSVPPDIKAYDNVNLVYTNDGTTVAVEENGGMSGAEYAEAFDAYFEDTNVLWQGAYKDYEITLAEADTVAWLLQLNEKLKEEAYKDYYNDLMLAAMYVNHLHGNDEKVYGEEGEAKKSLKDIWYGNGLDPGIAYNYTLDGIQTPWPDGNDYDFYDIYISSLISRMEEACDNVKKIGGGAEDLAKYMLYRDSTLVFGGAEYEKPELVTRSIGNVIDDAFSRERYYEQIENGLYTTAGVFALLLDFGSASVALAGAAVNKRTKEEYQELIRTVSCIRDGEAVTKAAHDKDFKDFLEEWVKKYEIAQKELEKLNIMTYGTAQRPKRSEDDADPIPIGYEQMKAGMDLLYSQGLRGFGVEDAEGLYTEEIFEASKAGEAGAIPEAMDVMNLYLANQFAGAQKTLLEAEKKLRDEQALARDIYWQYVTNEQEIDAGDRAKLKELAIRAADVTLSVDEREQAARAYEEYFNRILPASNLEGEFAKYAQAAWGEKTWNSYQNDMNLLSHAAGLYGSRVRYERESEPYTQWAEQWVEAAILAVEEHRSLLELEAEQTRLGLIASDFQKQKTAWEEQMRQITVIAGKEWEKARGRLNEGYNQWRRAFADEYTAKSTAWEANYLEFVLEKQEWVETQYMQAVNVGNAGILEQAGTDVGEAIGRALAGTMVERMNRAEFEVGEYVETLLAGTKLSELMTYTGSLSDRGKYGAAAVWKGNSRESVVESLAVAKAVQEGLNEELRTEAARLAAMQARKIIAEAIAAYMERVDKENEGMWEMEQAMVRREGYSIGADGISRRAVVDSTLFGGIETKTQRVHRYQNFTIAAPEVSVSIDSAEANGLGPEAIMALVHQGQRELEAWGEEVFGRIEKNEYGRMETVKHQIAKTPAVSIEKQYQLLAQMEAIRRNSAQEYASETTVWTAEKVIKAHFIQDYESFSAQKETEQANNKNAWGEERDGKLGKHIGYGPTFRESPDMKEGREANLEYQGSGQMGEILLHLQWNAMETNAGWQEAAKPIYDQKMWKEDGFIEPLTIRSASALGAQIAGTVVGAIVSAYATPIAGALVSWAITTIDSLQFAVLDTYTTNRDNSEIWAEFGKHTAISGAASAISAGAGMAGQAAANIAMSAGQQAVLQGAISAAGAYSSKVTVGYLDALDFRTGEMDWGKANQSWYSADTIAGTLSAGVTAGLGVYVSSKLPAPTLAHFSGVVNIGTGLVGEAARFSVYAVYNLESGMSFEDSVSKAWYEDVGGLTLNLLNVATIARMFGADAEIANEMDMGLFEVNFGKGKMTSRFGTGGIDVSRMVTNLFMDVETERKFDPDSPEWKIIEDARDKAVNGLDDIINELASGNISDETKESAKKWLGIDLNNKNDREKNINDLTEIKQHLNNMDINDFRLTDSGREYYAMVIPPGNHIHLDPSFFYELGNGIPGKGAYQNNTREGTLVHETSHFLSVLGTNFLNIPNEVYWFHTDTKGIPATTRTASNWERYYMDVAFKKKATNNSAPVLNGAGY